MIFCFPSRRTRVRIPRTGYWDYPLEGEVGRWGCFALPAASQLVSTFFRRIPPGSDLTSSCWKAYCWRIRAVNEEDGSLVTRCGHTCCSGQGEPTLLLPGALADGLRKPTSGPACRLLPSPVQVLPVVVPPSCATLVVRR